ncbi:MULTISPECIES: helix-turn-helix domain-containing protein [Aminobacter]|uniref:MerR family transcriptional regulator n=2 Tax=Aminobacter TaxID=31988 RepID=A0AAC8YUJ6_AMIAI|nr:MULTISPECIES: XRE family transcriptional regulator [Aminobacter]AMS44513.1 MerR family transcriptional regulator [Aminobacter aminovorans]MBA8910668.1 transcriptional regulator with XRE-family HTH domain [Aminobacter ciceronei]MBA9024452.1 transcriptional regulator with XRE-family HTH domain [Aminobacter ciceronei]MBB3704211.1 transcriptional regulator with XRE-family HTH domain [Aminobacter aminovorans]MRX32545.1 helix-turn-helix domain-containing protein [Aminobacter sp. MDW-2]
MSSSVLTRPARAAGFLARGATAFARTAAPAALQQDPHAVRAPSENELQAAIGREVRACRKRRGMTATELAGAANISVGMMSKIENGVISASLTTLQALSQALGVPMTALLRSFEDERSAVFVRAGTGVEVERRGTRAGHHYNLLGYIGSSSSTVSVEPYLITLTSHTDTFPLFQHAGMEFLYLLEGEITYRHGPTLYHMSPGDSLFFEADTPHGPEQLTKLPIRFLSIISYPQGGED